MQPLKSTVIITGLLLLAVIINKISIEYSDRAKSKTPTVCWEQTIPNVPMYHRAPCRVSLYQAGD